MTKHNELKRLARKRDKLQRELGKVTREMARIRISIAHEEFGCECVRLNSDIGVYDCAEQERMNRNGLMCGLVADTLSADKACHVCRGSGVVQHK